MGTQAFVGHRFKQLLVNGTVAWEQDVADDELAEHGTAKTRLCPDAEGYLDPYRVIDIAGHVTGQFTLTLRVVDKVGSLTHLPGDLYRRFSWSAHDPEKARRNFQTTVYFGDVAITLYSQPVRPKARRRTSRTPTRGCGVKAPRSGIRLQLSGPARLPRAGFPVRCGIPLPEGKVAPGRRFLLRDARGRALPLAATETSHWPDGTVRWVLCEFVAPRRGCYRLIPGARPGPEPVNPVRVHSDTDGTEIANGSLTVRIAGQTGLGVWESASCAKGMCLGKMDMSIKVNRVGWRDAYHACRRSVQIERANAVCAVVRIEGDMQDDAGRLFGPWQVRLHIWAGVPFIMVEWRQINASDQAMAVLLDWFENESARMPGERVSTGG